MLKKLLGTKIKEIRKSLLLTQEEFADCLGLHRSTLARIERGQTFPTPETLEKIRTTAEIEYSQLFTFSEDTIPVNPDKKLHIKMSRLSDLNKKYLDKHIDLYIEEAKEKFKSIQKSN